MRQAGRHLPEYRAIRERHSFQEVVATPELASEVTLQPIRRYDMDGAVIFADIMTPLEAMGVSMTFDPGPKLQSMDVDEVARLPGLDQGRVGAVADTIGLVASQVPGHTAVIGFAGGPVTLLAYLLEGGGSKDFMSMRSALRSRPDAAAKALDRLAVAMNSYLALQVEAGAEVVQLFDTWAGLLDEEGFEEFAVPAARRALDGLDCPTIYFAPGAGHCLGAQRSVGATGIGVDWRIPIDQAFEELPGHAIQGNLDPALLHADESAVRKGVASMLDAVGGRTGHIMNLGHGIDRNTDPRMVEVFVEAVRS
jgi:uroporphyrinogen decarboxylase